jgi:hypothetical protein
MATYSSNSTIGQNVYVFRVFTAGTPGTIYTVPSDRYARVAIHLANGASAVRLKDSFYGYIAVPIKATLDKSDFAYTLAPGDSIETTGLAAVILVVEYRQTP